jgi:hypothetical protein
MHIAAAWTDEEHENRKSEVILLARKVVVPFTARLRNMAAVSSFSFARASVYTHSEQRLLRISSETWGRAGQSRAKSDSVGNKKKARLVRIAANCGRLRDGDPRSALVDDRSDSNVIAKRDKPEAGSKVSRYAHLKKRGTVEIIPGHISLIVVEFKA